MAERLVMAKCRMHHQQPINDFVRFSIAVQELLNLTNEQLICFYEECLVMAKFFKDILLMTKSYLYLGSLYEEKLLRYEEAKDIYEEILRLFLTHFGDKEIIGDVSLHLERINRKLGKYHDAIGYAHKALSIFKEIGNKILEGTMYRCLATSAISLGKFGDAIKHSEEALAIAKIEGDKDGEKCAYEMFGEMYRQIGRFKDAIIYLKKAFDIANCTGDRVKKGKCYGDIGECYEKLEKSTKAKMYYEKELSIALETCNKELQQSAYGHLARHYSSSNYDLAIRFHEKAITISREINSKDFLVIECIDIGLTYLSSQQFQKAIGCFEEALSIAIKINNTRGEAIAYCGLGLSYFQIYLSMDRLPQNVSASWSARQVDKERLQETITKSEYNFKEGVKQWEWLFDQLEGHHHLQITFFDQVVEAYKGLITVLLMTGQTQDALLYSERARARVLVDLLTTKYDMKVANVPSFNYSDLETVWSDGQFCILFYSEKYLWILPEQKRQQNENMQNCSIPIDNINSKNLSEVFQFLKVEEGVKCENRSLEPPSKSDEMKSPSNKKRGKNSNSNEKPDDGQHTIHPLKKLFTLLVSAVPHLQQEEVVIIPEGPLYTVPFAALCNPNTGKYLSETKRIRHAPSITTLKLLKECPANYHSKTGALVIGNPDVGQVMFRGEVTTFEPLKWAETEADLIGRILHVTPLTRAQAFKDEVLNKLKEGVAVIHIAAHGCPENGEIALAPPSKSREGGRIPEEEDYLLTMKEVQKTGVRAQLVVLSCCHSGCGEIRSEGVIGLTRAFLAAGARSVVASLWPISDDATLSFMISFYQYLKKGKSASASMQYAMNELRKDEYHRAPRHWASFFLMGDDVTISI